MLEILLATWNKEALYHEWKLPDGYQAHVKVLDQKIVRLEIDWLYCDEILPLSDDEKTEIMELVELQSHIT